MVGRAVLPPRTPARDPVLPPLLSFWWHLGSLGLVRDPLVPPEDWFQDTKTPGYETAYLCVTNTTLLCTRSHF